MGRYQPQRVNSELKQYFVVNDFSGGINTTDTDDRMYDNEFRRLINVDLSEAGSLKRRKGWGLYANLNKLIYDAKIVLPKDNLFLFSLIYDSYINIDELTEKIPSKYAYKFLVGYYERALDNTYTLFFKLLTLQNELSSFSPIDNGSYKINDTQVIFKNLIGSIDVVKYLDRVYFMLNQISNELIGMGVYDIGENKIYFIDKTLDGQQTSSDYFFDYLNSNEIKYLKIDTTDTTRYSFSDAWADAYPFSASQFDISVDDISIYELSTSDYFIPYKPSPAEITDSTLGYNMLSRDPLSYYSTNTESKGIKGFYLTEINTSDRVLKGIPSTGKFRINIILTGTWTRTEFETVFRFDGTVPHKDSPFLEYSTFDVEKNSYSYSPLNYKYVFSLGNSPSDFFSGDQADNTQDVSGSGFVSYDITIDDQQFSNLQEVRINLTSFKTDYSTPEKIFDSYSDMINNFSWYVNNGEFVSSPIDYSEALNKAQFFLATKDGKQLSFSDTSNNLILYKKTTATTKEQVSTILFSSDSTTISNSFGYFYYPNSTHTISNTTYNGYEYVFYRLDSNTVYPIKLIRAKHPDTDIEETSSDYLNFIWTSDTASGYLDDNNDYKYYLPNYNEKSYYAIKIPGSIVNYAYYRYTVNSSKNTVVSYINDFDSSYSFKAEKPILQINERAKKLFSLFRSEYADSIKMSRVGDFLVLHAGNSMIWSSRGNFTYFPNINYKIFPIEADDDITAVQFFRGSHLVFTKKTIWRISGELDDLTNLTFTLINDAIGCIAPKSVHSFENTVVFLSSDGLYRVKQAYFQGGLENVEKIDLQLKDYLFVDSEAESYLYNEQYWLMSKNNEDYDTLKYYYSIATRYGHPYTVDKYPDNHKPTSVCKIGNNMLSIKNGIIYVYNNGYYDFLNSSVLESEKKDYVYKVKILTGSLSFGYSTHEKKFKSLFANVVSSSGDPLSVIAYFNGVTSSQYSKYTIVQNTDGTFEYVDSEADPTIVGRGSTLAAADQELSMTPTQGLVGENFVLGFSVLGDETPLLHKLQLSGKAKSISIFLEQNTPYSFAIKDIGYLFKLGKVKEAR